MPEEYTSVWLFGLVGVVVIIFAVVRICVHEFHRRKQKAGHNDADYNCRYWWGDRQESIGAHCRICNPQRENVLGDPHDL